MFKTIGSYAEASFIDTWGHTAPHKNVSYKGVIRVMHPIHGGNNGWGMTLLDYYFPNLEGGPYIHEASYKFINELNDEYFEPGAIYDIPVTFRNYRMYNSKPIVKLQRPQVNEQTRRSNALVERNDPGK